MHELGALTITRCVSTGTQTGTRTRKDKEDVIQHTYTLPSPASSADTSCSHHSSTAPSSHSQLRRRLRNTCPGDILVSSRSLSLPNHIPFVIAPSQIIATAPFLSLLFHSAPSAGSHLPCKISNILHPLNRNLTSAQRSSQLREKRRPSDLPHISGFVGTARVDHG